MGGLFGGGDTISSSEPRIGAMRVQTSAYGMAIPLVYGRTRIAANMIWYGDFTAIAHTTTQSAGGKGGGDVTSSNTSYTYTTATALGLCEGQINGINNIWAGSDLVATRYEAPPEVQITDEMAVVPASGIVQVAYAPMFKADAGVKRHGAASVFNPTNFAAITPLQAGADYTASKGQYAFAPALIGTTVYISYTYQQSGHDASALQQLGLTLFDGSSTQSEWGYLSTNHPDQALAYRNLAYAAATAYDLGSSAQLPNHSFEVSALFDYSPDGGTTNGAKAEEVLVDYLTNARYGVGFDTSWIGDLTQFAQHAKSLGILISPAYVEQSQAADHLKEIATATNSAIFSSEGKLKAVPYSDLGIINTSWGAVFIPNMTPEYDLNDDDFLGDSSTDPVKVTRKTQADAYNQVQVEFIDSANQYNVAIAEAKDQANIELYGLRPMEPVKLHLLNTKEAAKTAAQFILQRALYIRNTYEFTLGIRYSLLEPMDIVTITDDALGLDKTPVRIIEIEETPEGEFNIKAEEMPDGVSHAALYPSQTSYGYQLSYNESAGNVSAPSFFEMAVQNTTTGLAVGVAVSGTKPNYGGCEVWLSYDDKTYKKMGIAYGGSRYGIISGSMPATVNAVASVELAGNGGQIITGSATEAKRLATLCIIGDEFCAHTDAALTGPNKYNLTMSLRGVYGTPISSHKAGDRFIRIDDSVLVSESLNTDLIGSDLYFKFLSFNSYTASKQTLAEVSYYKYTITGAMATLPPSDITGLTSSLDGDSVKLSWDYLPAIDLSHYEIREGDSWDTATFVQEVKDSFYTVSHVAVGSHTYLVKAVDLRQNYSGTEALTVITFGDVAGGSGSIPGASIKSAKVEVDPLGNAIISFTAIKEPQISGYELRSGTTFESGILLGTTSGSSFSVPVLSVTGQTLWIKGIYSAGGYTASSFRIAFGSATLGQVQGLSWRISEPDMVFTWGAVAGASQYVTLFEDGGVTRIKVVATPEVSFPIPKWSNAQFRVFGISSTGAMTPYNDINITLSGVYSYNEIVNVNLPITTGKYINLAFTAANQIKRVSLLGSDPVAPYVQNINDADLYAFGYNLANLAASSILNVKASWFRDGFWREKNGFFESGVLDLGSVLSGKLLLNLSKTINYTGSGPVSGYSKVRAEYMAYATPQEIMDTKAFLSARLLVASDSAYSGNWTEVQNGDWVSGVRYVKLVVEVAMAGPLTDVTVTAGYITLDVPDISEQGTLTGVTSAGSLLTFAKTYHHISTVIATAQGAAKAYTDSPTLASCHVYVDTGTQNVGYFVKGY